MSKQIIIFDRDDFVDDPVFREKLNTIAGYASEGIVVQKPLVLEYQPGQGFLIRLEDVDEEEAEAEVGDASELYKIQSIENDYLVCKTWDGTTLGTDAVKIAKPWLLQHQIGRYATAITLASVDSQTVNVGFADDVEATWKVAPAYAVDDLIQAVARLTGVTETIEDEAIPLLMMDINHDARAWCEIQPEPEE